ncbi:PREDICTED: putative nuclease HARBI1 [Trachymyrmex cornetzi]|uniref:putative nuclease HARBI1 n=1 Tax=Trachymyrmex cornetzi TaxID=471704 RepID=UPI00084EEF40|nr:PREDICTED: putative nuclease HARBI1 [Trachymyrmex cornetzi]
MVEIAVISVVQIMKNNYSSSDENSSSDEEYEILLRDKKKRVKRPRIENYLQTVSRYMDYEFKSHFRSICDRFNVGRATALRAVRRVTRALFTIAPQFISWPSNEDAQIIMHKFEEASGFPNTIGAIDGTHIRIEAPKENAVDYINRKGYHSIQLQAVCDHRALITHCYIGHPGSVHDQRIFRQSEVATFLNIEEKFPNNSHLIGDAAYELHEHLLVPFKDNGHLSDVQKHYNFRHSSARTKIEQCFALLKGRLRSLMHCLPMVRVDLMPEYTGCQLLVNVTNQTLPKEVQRMGVNVVEIIYESKRNNRLESNSLDSTTPTSVMEKLDQINK